jgi:hypothetical protein
LCHIINAFALSGRKILFTIKPQGDALGYVQIMPLQGVIQHRVDNIKIPIPLMSSAHKYV